MTPWRRDEQKQGQHHGRGMSGGEDNAMAEERALSLPSPQHPAPRAPSPGTRGRPRGSTRRAPSPLSHRRSGWARSPTPTPACRHHPAPRRGSGKCTLPGGEGLLAAMAASQHTHGRQGKSPPSPEPSPPPLSPQHSHLPLYPPIMEIFWQKRPRPSARWLKALLPGESGVTGQHMVPRGAAGPVGAAVDPALGPGPRAAPGYGVDPLAPESVVCHALLPPVLVLQPGQHGVTGVLGAWGHPGDIPGTAHPPALCSPPCAPPAACRCGRSWSS